MVANILDGKSIAQGIICNLKATLGERGKLGISPPKIVVILIGDDPASELYVKNKLTACAEAGIVSSLLKFEINIPQTKILALIAELNADPAVNAILVQLPVPATFSLAKIFSAIDPLKDVDGFHPTNLGLLAQGWPTLQSCTAKGVMKLLACTKVDLSGKHAVIVGASNIVGKPIAYNLINAGSTVTICNKYTKDLAAFVHQADLVISAVGKPNLIKGAWIKQGSIILDVGITRINSQILGDVEFSIAKKVAGWITKVPGGVGPMTVACLLENILLTQQLQEQTLT